MYPIKSVLIYNMHPFPAYTEDLFYRSSYKMDHYEISYR